MNESAERKQHEEDRGRAVAFGMFVYTGGVVAATSIFIFFILTAFPDSAYFIRFLMVVAALCVGASALAFRYALENWAVSGNHRKAAIGFYYGEIVLVGLNTIVSFSALLYKFAGNALPPWVQWYEPFTVATIAYVILAWGTLFVLDPKAKAKARQLQVLIDFDNKVIDGMSEYLGSEDGLMAIQENANARIRDNFAVKDRTPKPWINRDDQRGPTTPGIPVAPARPALPPARRPARPGWKYSVGDLCDLWGLTEEGAGAVLKSYGGPDEAFDVCVANGYLPDDMSPENFASIYFDLCPDPRKPVRIPRPVSRDNGANF